MKILVTGATGFVGKALTTFLSADPRYSVHVCVRRAEEFLLALPVTVNIADLTNTHDWSGALHSIDTVVHTAARVHVMREHAADPLIEFRRVNVDATLALAKQAAVAGVKRFIFISSIKVNGEETVTGHPFRADDIPAPLDPYGVSKYEAEQGLLALANTSEMEIVIIRPVLIYGPGVKANFLSMMTWIDRKIPLPLGGLVDNRRSMVAIDNLIDLISACLDHPAAANQIFLVSDGEDLSTACLLRRVGNALGTPAILFPIPAWMLVLCASLIGKSSVAQRLCGSLQVDISKTTSLLKWAPPVTLDLALKKTASFFHSHK